MAAEAALHALKKLEANKTCVNCGNYNRFGHQNICEKVRTFVCSTCKSAHQSYSMRVKSVSMSNWTMAEVDALREQNGGGNTVAARVWYGRWDESQMRKPTKNDTLDYYKQCINRVYNDKAFYDADGYNKKAVISTSKLIESSKRPMTPATVTNLLDFGNLAQEQPLHDNTGAFGTSGNDEWSDFAAAPAVATSDPTPTSMPESNMNVGTVPASASIDLFGCFASASPAPASAAFGPFAGVGGNVLTPNATSKNCAAPFGTFAPAFTKQQSAVGNSMNQCNAAAAPKDFSVFDELSPSSIACGTARRKNSDQAYGLTGMGLIDHNQQLGMQNQHCGGYQRQQQHYHLQPMMGSGKTGMNISAHCLPEACGTTSKLSGSGNNRDPFAGLGL